VRRTAAKPHTECDTRISQNVVLCFAPTFCPGVPGPLQIAQNLIFWGQTDREFGIHTATEPQNLARFKE
jgi:hypothetical protein